MNQDQYNYSIDVDFQYVLERDSDSEKGKYGQLYYLTNFLKKCIKYSLFGKFPLVNAMDMLSLDYTQPVAQSQSFKVEFKYSNFDFEFISIDNKDK